MSEDDKRPFFTTLPGILTGSAALIGALTTLYVAVRNQQPSRPETPAGQLAPPLAQSTESQPPTTPSRQVAERLAADYLAAWHDHDLALVVSLSEIPFYFDHQVLLRREDIRRKYEELFAEKQNLWDSLQINSIRASTIGELTAQGDDINRDRVVRSISMDQNDWAIQILVRTADARTAGLVLFARTFNNTLRIVGMWD
jgi:hypothetical protein